MNSFSGSSVTSVPGCGKHGPKAVPHSVESNSGTGTDVASWNDDKPGSSQFTFSSNDTGELYDLERDPYQLDNRYGDPDYDEVRRDLMSRMERHMTELRDPVLGWFRRMSPVY